MTENENLQAIENKIRASIGTIKFLWCLARMRRAHRSMVRDLVAQLTKLEQGQNYG